LGVFKDKPITNSKLRASGQELMLIDLMAGLYQNVHAVKESAITLCINTNEVGAHAFFPPRKTYVQPNPHSLSALSYPAQICTLDASSGAFFQL
jgi:hypothetical protein